MNRTDQRLIAEEAQKAIDPIVTWKTQFNRFLDSLENLKVTILSDKSTKERTHTPGGGLGPPVEYTYIQFKIEGPLYLPANLPYDTGHFKNEKEMLNSEFFNDLDYPKPNRLEPALRRPPTHPIEKLLYDQALNYREDRVSFKVKALRIVRDPVNPDLVMLYLEALLNAEKYTHE